MAQMAVHDMQWDEQRGSQMNPKLHPVQRRVVDADGVKDSHLDLDPKRQHKETKFLYKNRRILSVEQT